MAEACTDLFPPLAATNRGYATELKSIVGSLQRDGYLDAGDVQAITRAVDACTGSLLNRGALVSIQEKMTLLRETEPKFEDPVAKKREFNGKFKEAIATLATDNSEGNVLKAATTVRQALEYAVDIVCASPVVLPKLTDEQLKQVQQAKVLPPGNAPAQTRDAILADLDKKEAAATTLDAKIAVWRDGYVAAEKNWNTAQNNQAKLITNGEQNDAHRDAVRFKEEAEQMAAPGNTDGIKTFALDRYKEAVKAQPYVELPAKYK